MDLPASNPLQTKNGKLIINIVWLPKFINDVLFISKCYRNSALRARILCLPIFYYCCVLLATIPVFGRESKTLLLNTMENDRSLSVNLSYKIETIIQKRRANQIKTSDRNYASSRRLLDTAYMLAEEEYYESDEIGEDKLSSNLSEKGLYIGSQCDQVCNRNLHHVECNLYTKTCSCERNYPVILGIFKGCAKPKQLGEQCFYHQTCQYSDENSLCVQINHNARCQCSSGFHSVAYSKPTKRVFCTQDLAAITSDLPTLLGVTTGIAVLAGLICMVLHLFSKTKYPRHRSLANANIPPPILYSSDTGSRRPSLVSIHSTSSSVRSYGVMRFEKEMQQKEIRQELKLHACTKQNNSQGASRLVVGRTISYGAIAKMVPKQNPTVPSSMDELLPSVDESKETAASRNSCSFSDRVLFHRSCNISNNDL